jgi:hypothetical protein
MLTEVIFQLLTNDPTIVSLVGTIESRSTEDPGIFPVESPEETSVPYIVYQQIWGKPVTSMDGNNRLQRAGFQFSCVGGSSYTSHVVSEAVKQLFGGLYGQFGNGGSPVSFVQMQGVWLTDERDIMEEDTHGLLSNVQVDFEFNFADLVGL